MADNRLYVNLEERRPQGGYEVGQVILTLKKDRIEVETDSEFGTSSLDVIFRIDPETHNVVLTDRMGRILHLQITERYST